MTYTVHRDFRTSTKQQLLAMCQEVEPKDNWLSHVADDLGDIFALTGAVRRSTDAVQYGLAVADSYHRNVIDANNASQDQIRAIWRNVNATANTYLSKAVATDTDLAGFQSQLDALTNAMGTGATDGGLDDTTVGGLTAGVNNYLCISRLLGETEGKGFDGKTDNTDNLFAMLQAMGRTAFDLCPDLKAGGSWECALGPGLSIRFSVTGEGDGGAPATLDLQAIHTADGQKDQLKALLSPNKSGLELDKYGIPTNTNGWAVDTPQWDSNDMTVTTTAHRTQDGATETYTLTYNRKTHKSTISLSVSQASGATIVTSEAALTADSKLDWHDYQPAVQPEPAIRLPELEGWEHIKIPEASTPGTITAITAIGGTILTLLTFLVAVVK